MMTSLRQRALLAVTVLFCTMALAACNLLTAPSETAGSHDDDPGKTILVRLRYGTLAGVTAPPEVEVTTISLRDGDFLVAPIGYSFVRLQKMHPNDSVTFNVRSQGNRTATTTCTWGGASNFFGPDTTVQITDAGAGNPIRITCDQGW